MRWSCKPQARRSRGPQDHLIYIIGDIHGRADLLKVLLRKIEADAHAFRAAAERTVAFLGDYVDRGPSSATVIELILELQAHGAFSVVALRGNHDQVLL